MYSLVYRVYYILKRKQKRDKENGKNINRITQKMIDRIEWFYNILMARIYEKCPSTRSGLNYEPREEKIIVSLTSFPKRIEVVWLTVETLLRQTMKPDEIILWLADSQFDGIEAVPQRLRDLQKRGLTIRFCEDLRSHKKYFYTMAEHPEDLIILTDDDVFFPYDMIEQLYKLHKKNPREIIGSTVAKVDDYYSVPTYWGRLKSGERVEHSMHIQPFTGQGTLYPPHCFDEEYLLNKDLIMELCPYADDLWLFYMALRKKTPVSVVYKERAMPVGIYGTGESSLWQINGKERKNDTQWNAILNYFGEKIDDTTSE